MNTQTHNPVQHGLMVRLRMEDEMGKGMKVPVTLRALIARINRSLARGGMDKGTRMQLVKSRGELRIERLGEYYIIDVTSTGQAMGRNSIYDEDVDPVRVARKLDLLKPWEEVQR